MIVNTFILVAYLLIQLVIATSEKHSVNIDLETSFIYIEPSNNQHNDISLTICYIETNPKTNTAMKINEIASSETPGSSFNYTIDLSDSMIYKKRYYFNAEDKTKLESIKKSHWMKSADLFVNQVHKLSKLEETIEILLFKNKVVGSVLDNKYLYFEITDFCSPLDTEVKHTLSIKTDKDVIKNRIITNVVLYMSEKKLISEKSVINSYPEDFSLNTNIDFTNELHFVLMLNPKDNSHRKVWIIFAIKASLLSLALLVTIICFYYYKKRKYKKKKDVIIYQRKTTN